MVKIHVCIGSACHLKGSYNIINSLEQLSEEYGIHDQVEIAAAFCLGHCTDAVSVQVGENELYSVSSGTVQDFFVKHVLPKATA